MTQVLSTVLTLLLTLGASCLEPPTAHKMQTLADCAVDNECGGVDLEVRRPEKAAKIEPLEKEN